MIWEVGYVYEPIGNTNVKLACTNIDLRDEPEDCLIYGVTFKENRMWDWVEGYDFADEREFQIIGTQNDYPEMFL